MNRKLLAILCLLVVALLALTACSGKKETFEEYQPISQVLAPTAPDEQKDEPAAAEPDLYEDQGMEPSGGLMDQNPYEDEFADFMEQSALGEEEVDPYAGMEENDYFFDYMGEATVYPYAGSTPIPLDPIDMPTPTPKPELTYDYMDYVSQSLGLSFKAPAGWFMDESQVQLCILSEPDSEIKDGQAAIITISAEPVTAKYSEKELKKHVNQRLNSLYTSDMRDFNQSLTATRKMIGVTGVYANYNATMMDGTKIGGRILYASKDKTLYGLEIVYPYGYKGSFENVFGEVRSSMKAN